MKIMKISADNWARYSEHAHLICFNEVRPAHFNRIDFAFVAEEDEIPLTYMTCREVDHESVYMQYGGAFPSAKGTLKSFHSYVQMIDELSKTYKRATTLISNKNHAMMKFAMKVGLEIIGVRYFKGEIFLEHLIEFGGQNE